MTLPVGQISMQQVNTELSVSPATTLISLNQANVRALAGVPSGTISMSNLQGKSNAFPFSATIAAPVQNYNLRTAMVAAGYPGTGAFTAAVTINSGVYVWSDDTAIAGLDTGALSGGAITITNNGYIMGKGGQGATATATPTPGSPGGAAVNLQHPATIVNNSYVAGGGGGGVGQVSATYWSGGGGGAGGGTGGAGRYGPIGTLAIGGAGGAIGASGGNGNRTGSPPQPPGLYGGGGGGGRILPGTGGSGTNPANLIGGVGGGAGGGGASHGGSVPVPLATGPGGAGGSAGAAGSPAPAASPVPGAGGGGGWGAAGGSCPAGTTAGTGGNAVTLNGNAVTWPVVGTRYGSIA